MAPTADLKRAVDTSKLANKSVLVTGGASGLGSLIAAEAAKHG
jgi:NADP-dependent 3-hydroxy acid dehydrogenase YdfG